MLKFRGGQPAHENNEYFTPRKLPAIRYSTTWWLFVTNASPLLHVSGIAIQSTQSQRRSDMRARITAYSLRSRDNVQATIHWTCSDSCTHVGPPLTQSARYQASPTVYSQWKCKSYLLWSPYKQVTLYNYVLRIRQQYVSNSNHVASKINLLSCVYTLYCIQLFETLEQ